MIKQVSAPFSKNNSTANQNIMLILKGNKIDGATWLRLVSASLRKQDGYHRSFYKANRHRPGGIDCWLDKSYFTINKGRAITIA